MEKYESVTMDLGEMSLRSSSISGEQMQASKSIITSEKENIKIGVWECTKGVFESHRKDDCEVSHIISGEAIVTEYLTGESLNIKAGDTIVLPIGWKGKWDIKKDIRKLYVSKSPIKS